MRQALIIFTMNKSEMLKKDCADVIKASLIAVLISLVLVLVFALIVRWASLDETAMTIGNYVIKAVSLLAGIIIGFKRKSAGAVKGALAGVLYMLIGVFVFAVADGFKNVQFSFIDLFTLTLAGIISGIIAVNIKPRRDRRA